MRLPTTNIKNHVHLYSFRDSPRIPSRILFLRSFSEIRPLIITHDGSPHVPERELMAIRDRVNRFLQNAVPPSEESILSELQHCEAYAKSIKHVADSQIVHTSLEQSPISTLLSLDEGHKKVGSLLPTTSDQSIEKKIKKQISSFTYGIVTDPKVFITPKILTTYVRIQSLLGHPETIPQVFVLYAFKPVPILGSSSPLQFKSSNPNKLSSAIPLATASMALNAAIKAKDLPLCFDIINNSVGTTAFRRSKIFRRALLPMSGMALMPVAAYSLASHLSTYQDTMESSVATNVTFVGILAYVGFTSTIGFVVVTTANDQMDRITWVTGTPLRERWLREDERAFIDQVAGAWGFQETSRRGEEEGKEWDMLREWVGLKGMILDRVELMEGME